MFYMEDEKGEMLKNFYLLSFLEIIDFYLWACSGEETDHLRQEAAHFSAQSYASVVTHKRAGRCPVKIRDGQRAAEAVADVAASIR